LKIIRRYEEGWRAFATRTPDYKFVMDYLLIVETSGDRDQIHNNDANSWRSSSTVSSSSNSLFSRSESRSCETALHSSRTSELTTGSIVFTPMLVLANLLPNLYQKKHG